MTIATTKVNLTKNVQKFPNLLYYTVLHKSHNVMYSQISILYKFSTNRECYANHIFELDYSPRACINSKRKSLAGGPADSVVHVKYEIVNESS